MAPGKGGFADDAAFGSPMGDRPDRFRLSEPSGRVEGAMAAWWEGEILQVVPSL